MYIDNKDTDINPHNVDLTTYTPEDFFELDMTTTMTYLRKILRNASRKTDPAHDKK